MTYTLLITGANRGIGLEFTKQYLAAGWQVHACCRQPAQADALNKLQQQYDQLIIHKLDIIELDDIARLSAELADVAIDVLLLNAGIYGQDNVRFGEGAVPLSSSDVSNIQQVFTTNVIAPLIIVEAFYKQVQKSQLKKIAYLSSLMGSISDNQGGGSYAYRASKAAGNMIMKNLAIDLEKHQINVLILHPGWVKTDMGGVNAPLDVESSVAGLRAVISRTDIPSGSFHQYDGKEVSW